MSEVSLTWNQTVKGITEFIEVAIHTILYVRQIYPADLFVRRKKYDTPVFQSRHPALNEYISGTVKAVADELVLGNVDKVVVVIKDNNQVALERFIFSIQNMIEVESYNKDTSVQDAMSSAKLGQYFRSFLIKLNMIESQLGLLELPSGDEASFAVVLELKDNTAPSASKDKDPPPWVPADLQHTTSGASKEAQLHLLRAVDTGIINISLAVQESEEKLQLGKASDDSANDIKGKGKDKTE
ncbi:mitotic spindle assembly checkpoint protein [Rhizopogon vesiculosus]|uniref:Mitotic spindle assembly checkpoint protein n=1 Tax=Rhizopogon vesiculosus TaxID=180088 RepID=A0A1J8QIR4_9AGAM|nr:mitotic spindle assembly checkpoint protein [Rhizopogon vesiculosus]